MRRRTLIAAALIAYGLALYSLVSADVDLSRSPPSAEARGSHSYIEKYSERIWEQEFRGRCGDGAAARCNWRQRDPSCHIEAGRHSRKCFYAFGESSWWNGWHYRRCEINGISTHGEPVSWSESCHQ